MPTNRGPQNNIRFEQLRQQLQKESGDSVRLLNDIQNNPICSLSFDEASSSLVLIWKGYATSPQIRYIHEYIIYLLHEHGARKILGDDSALPMVHAEDQTWIVEDWMPRAQAAGLKVAATKRSNAYFGRQSIDSIRVSAPSNLVLRSFDNLDDARTWLADIKI